MTVRQISGYFGTLVLVWMLLGCAAQPGTAEPTASVPALTPTPAPTESPAPAASPSPDSTVLIPPGWEAYTDPGFGYTFYHPDTWELCTDTGFSRLYCAPSEPGGPKPPDFYISVLPKGFTNEQAEAYNFMSESLLSTFASIEVGQTASIEPALQDNQEFFTFTRLPDTTLDGESAIVIENQRVWEAGPNVKERRVLLIHEDVSYVLGTYYETEEQLATFNTLLSLFEVP